jgi:hypothetical protein
MNDRETARELQLSMGTQCSCIICPDCNGSGSVWHDWRGRYLGRSRCDDLDELETCMACRGSGYTEQCENCFREDDEY